MAAMAALMIVDRTCQASAYRRSEVGRPCTIEFFFLNDMLRSSWGALPAWRNHDRINHRRQNRCSPATTNEKSGRIRKRFHCTCVQVRLHKCAIRPCSSFNCSFTSQFMAVVCASACERDLITSVRMSQTYRLHARPAAVSRAPTLSENFESGPSRRCRVPRDSTSSEEQMEIDAFWGGGARPALRPDGGRNLFPKKYDSLLPVSACAGGNCESEQGDSDGENFDACESEGDWRRHRGVGGRLRPGSGGRRDPDSLQQGAGRAVRFGGVPVPASPVMGWAQARGDWPTPPPSHGLGAGSGVLAHPPAQSRVGRSLGGLAHPPPSHRLRSGCEGGLGLSYLAYMSATPGTYLSFSPDFFA
jgi:hypothetical protein